MASAQAASGQLMSHNTYANIVNNKSNIDYCIDQFNFVSSRIKCIKCVPPPTAPESRFTLCTLGVAGSMIVVQGGGGLRAWAAEQRHFSGLGLTAVRF